MLRRFRDRRALMRQDDWQFRHQGREFGYPVCQTDSELIKGPESVGHRYGVSLQTKCSQGKPIALFHTHPGGETIPSAADIREAYRYKLPVCIGVPETGEQQCWNPTARNCAVSLLTGKVVRF